MMTSTAAVNFSAMHQPPGHQAPQMWQTMADVASSCRAFSSTDDVINVRPANDSSQQRVPLQYRRATFRRYSLNDNVRHATSYSSYQLQQDSTVLPLTPPSFEEMRRELNELEYPETSCEVFKFGGDRVKSCPFYCCSIEGTQLRQTFAAQEPVYYRKLLLGTPPMEHFPTASTQPANGGAGCARQDLSPLSDAAICEAKYRRPYPIERQRTSESLLDLTFAGNRSLPTAAFRPDGALRLPPESPSRADGGSQATIHHRDQHYATGYFTEVDSRSASSLTVKELVYGNQSSPSFYHSMSLRDGHHRNASGDQLQYLPAAPLSQHLTQPIVAMKPDTERTIQKESNSNVSALAQQSSSNWPSPLCHQLHNNSSDIQLTNSGTSDSQWSPVEGQTAPTKIVSSTSIGKTRTKDKYRTVYTDKQRLELEAEYVRATYVSMNRKLNLSCTTGLSERQVKIWFQNRRAKDRRQQRKQKMSVGGITAGRCSSTSLTGSSLADNAVPKAVNNDVSSTSMPDCTTGCRTSRPVSTVMTANSAIETFLDCSPDCGSENWCYETVTLSDDRVFYGIH